MSGSQRAKRDVDAPDDGEPIVKALSDCGGRGQPHRSAFDFTPFENRALDLTRLIFDMHRSGDKNPWFAAMDLAEGAEGPFEGPYVVARVTALVRALLTERDRPFAYMSPGCTHLGSDEADLMRVVRLARTGPFGEFRAAVQALTGRDHVCRMLAPAMSLAQPEAARRAASARASGDDDPPPPRLLH